MFSHPLFYKIAPWLTVFVLLCSACQDIPVPPALTPSNPPIQAPTQTPLPSPTITPTPFQPSPTPLPLAARVNGEWISLEGFQAELARYQAAQSAAGVKETLDAAQERVLNNIINEVLLAQAARQAGFTEDDAALQARLDQLTAGAGGEEAFLRWLAANGYSEDIFRTALARAAAAAWMRDQIATKVLETADQVHARQILLYNLVQANQALAEIEAGKDFATLASVYDPVTGGDLGWFPRGYLTDLQLEEAAFNLQPGEYSAVITTPLGYHILQVIERAEARPLEPDARLALQAQALQNWLAVQRSESEIDIELPGFS